MLLRGTKEALEELTVIVDSFTSRSDGVTHYHKLAG